MKGVCGAIGLQKEEELCKKLMRRHHLRFVQPDIGYDHGPLSFLFYLVCICISFCVSVHICMRHHMFFVQLYKYIKIAFVFTLIEEAIT